MKIHSFTWQILLFFIIFLCCCTPPLFVSEVAPQTFDTWNFPFKQALTFIFGVILVCFEKNFLFTECHSKVYKKIIHPALALALLFAVSWILSFLSKVIPAEKPMETLIAKPESALAWIFCILNFLFSAFYEEVIYRFYLPEALSKIISQKLVEKQKLKTLLLVLSEIFVLVIFALSHRYMGVISVMNAFFGHIILRICFIKTRNLACSSLAHFSFNLIQLVISPF